MCESVFPTVRLLQLIQACVAAVENDSGLEVLDRDPNAARDGAQLRRRALIPGRSAAQSKPTELPLS